MVRGRAGGGGQPFNLGEASVTRATVRLSSGKSGARLCAGSRRREGRSAPALLDALWQREPQRIETEILTPLRAAAEKADPPPRRDGGHPRQLLHMVRGDD